MRRVRKCWHRLLREVGDAPSLETFSVRLDGALSSLVELMSLLVAGCWTRGPLKVPPSPNHSVILSLSWLQVTELVFCSRKRQFQKQRALTWSDVLGFDKALPPLVPAIPPEMFLPRKSPKAEVKEIHLQRRALRNALILHFLQTLLVRDVPSARCVFAMDGLRSVTPSQSCCATCTGPGQRRDPGWALQQRSTPGHGCHCSVCVWSWAPVPEAAGSATAVLGERRGRRRMAGLQGDTAVENPQLPTPP